MSHLSISIVQYYCLIQFDLYINFHQIRMNKYLIKNVRYFFGFKDMKKSFFQFLNLEAGAVYRGQPQFRQRKYLNIEITNQFKEIQKKRKQERLQHLKHKQKLLQSKVNTESKLLQTLHIQQLQKISEQVKSLTQLLQQQNKQLVQTQKLLQQTQADYIIVEGRKKLVILNQIVYLKYLSKHPSGKLLHPQSVAIIQNIHYLVTHNLPVQRYKLYQIFPNFFAKQINQLDESVKRLIEQKQLNMFQQDSSSIRTFRFDGTRHWPQQMIDMKSIQDQRDRYFNNANDQCERLLAKHKPLLANIYQGRTVFRNFKHAATCLLSEKLKLNLNEEESALKQTLLQITQIKREWEAYREQSNERMIQAKFSYIDPPEFVANHPLLSKKWDEAMQNYTSPVLMQTCKTWFPWGDQGDDEGRSIMQPMIRQRIQKFDDQFVLLFNTNSEKLFQMKHKFKIDFYNISTQVLQEYKQSLQLSKDEEEFKKLPKLVKKGQKFLRLTMDELTKMILLNNKNAKVYNFDFFSKYFGMQENIEEFKQMLLSVSYLRVQNIQKKQDEIELSKQKQSDPIKQSVLKFIM